MWKTRFEVNTPSEQKPLRSVSRSYSSQTTPTVPRVREDSPSALVRPSPPSSTPNLSILTEEDDEDNEQLPPISLVLPKYNNNNSYQAMSKHAVLLPTIIESHDQELLPDVPTNSNTQQTNIERPSRAVPIDKRIPDIRHKSSAREERVGGIWLGFAATSRGRATISFS